MGDINQSPCIIVFYFMNIPKTKNKSKKQKLKENRKGKNNTSGPNLKTWLCVTLARLPILSLKRQIH